MTRLLTCAVTLLLAGVLSAETITELTLTERNGLARQNEPVRAGVPLPAGLVKSVKELSLAASNEPIPAQFTEAMKWPDGSLRWVQVVFNATVPANGKLAVQLNKGQAQTSPNTLVVQSQGNAASVSNQFVKLVVTGGGLKIDLSSDPAGKAAYKPVISGGEIVAVVDGETLKSSMDKKGKVVVEEQGPQCAVLKATGHLTNGSATALAYTARFHVFAGTPMVRMDVSYTNDQGDDAASKLVMKDLSVVLPLANAASKYAIGGQSQTQAGDLPAGKTAQILAVSSEQSIISADGKELAQADNKKSKPLTIGWADGAAADGTGLAVSLRWFWQMFPKSLQVTDKAINISLYSALAAPDKPLDVYMGQGRTHYVTLMPHGAMTGEALNAALAPRQAPLRLVASPEYYCRTAKAFGHVADSDPAIYPGDLADALKAYDATLSKSLDAIVKKVDGCEYGGVTRDGYGYNYFGDVFHWNNKTGSNDPKDHLWESNYYDFPYATCLQFIRTGDEKYLDVTDPNGLHLADVFMCKWDPKDMYRGSCRYSPPADCVALDTTGKFTPYRSVEFNHHKAQSILARYLLLGDLQARDHFLLALNNAVLNPEESWRQCRGPGAKLATLYWGYQLTGDQKCLDVMKRVMGKAEAIKDAKGFSKQGASGYFMMGIAREGMLYWWWQTGDPKAIDTVKMITDFLLDGGGKLQGAQDAYPLAFCYRLTGDDKYRAAAIKLLARGGTEQRPKGFGIAWRSTPYAWYYLSTLAEKDKPATK